MLRLLINVLICPHATDLPYFTAKEPNHRVALTEIQWQEASQGSPPQTPVACCPVSLQSGLYVPQLRLPA